MGWRLHPPPTAPAGGSSPRRLFSLNVTSPVAAVVVVPCVPATGVVTVGGAVVWRDGQLAAEQQIVIAARRREHGGVEFSVAAGRYAFLRA